MNDKIKVIALSGLDENGRDCYVIEINNDIFVLDAGLSLPDKSMPGIDALLPNFEYLRANKERVKAYIIGQGHDENCGALEYLYPLAPAPIYCTQTTKDVIVFTAIQHHHSTNFDFVIVESTSKHIIAGREVNFFETAHNISDTFGIAISTSLGNIIYTGDYIIEFSSGETGFAFNLKALEPIASKPTFLLMSESKASTREGFCSPKHKIYNKIVRKITSSEKRVFISCFWENYYRIKEIIAAVKAAHKKIYFYNKFTKDIMENLIMNTKWCSLRKEDILSSDDLFRFPKKNLVILLLGSGADIYEEIGLIAANRNADKRIVLDKEDIFISASLPTPALETICTRNVDLLYRSGCEVLWLKNKDVTAMHPHTDDLKFFLSFFKPKYYLPVRGTYVNLMENAKLALSMNIGLNHMNVFILDNGMTLSFNENGIPSIKPYDGNAIPIAPILVDGTGISRAGADVVEDRRKLGVDGVVVIAATVNKTTHSLVAGPDCQMRGFVYVKEAEPILKSITKIFLDTIAPYVDGQVASKDAVLDDFKNKVSRFIRRELGRDPMILATLIDVD